MLFRRQPGDSDRRPGIHQVASCGCKAVRVPAGRIRPHSDRLVYPKGPDYALLDRRRVPRRALTAIVTGVPPAYPSPQTPIDRDLARRQAAMAEGSAAHRKPIESRFCPACDSAER